LFRQMTLPAAGEATVPVIAGQTGDVAGIGERMTRAAQRNRVTNDQGKND
jgi:hypothetical protein